MIRHFSLSFDVLYCYFIYLLFCFRWFVFYYFRIGTSLLFFVLDWLYTTWQGVVYQLDVALESVDTQRSGLVFIYDMSDSKYANFDYDLSYKILTLLKVISLFFFLTKPYSVKLIREFNIRRGIHGSANHNMSSVVYDDLCMLRVTEAPVVVMATNIWLGTVLRTLPECLDLFVRGRSGWEGLRVPALHTVVNAVPTFGDGLCLVGDVDGIGRRNFFSFVFTRGRKPHVNVTKQYQ